MIVSFPDFKVITQHKQLLQRVQLTDSKISLFNRYKDRTIFSGCHSTDGLKLSKSRMLDILSYLNNPTVEQWDKIYKYQIMPSKSLWDAWNKSVIKKIMCVKETPDLKDKWNRIPTPDELVKGIYKLKTIEYRKLSNLKDIMDMELSLFEFKYKNYLAKYA